MAIIIVIAFQGVVTHTVGASSEPNDAHGGVAPLDVGRSIFMARNGRLVTQQPPPGRRIALTFDDGPDAEWTPKIAAVLREMHVPATFFVVGSQAARHPSIIRALVRDGHEIANHTFTHTALTNGPEWQRRAQLDLTEAVLVGITGHYTRFVRPPYSATPDTVTVSEDAALAKVAGKRYYIVLADLDSEDWQRPGVAAVIRNASPRGMTGGVVMFHDGGGNRAETVQALRALIPRLRGRGFEFVSLASLAGLRANVVSPPAHSGQHVRGKIYLWSVRFAFFMTESFRFILGLVGILILARVAVLLTLATHHTRVTRRPRESEYLPSIAVVVPAYNEEVGIERAVRSLAASDYPDFSIVVVDDGSTDRTAEIIEGLDLPSVHLVRQDNAGKAAALNTGVRMSSSDVIVMVDGDTVFESDTLRCLVQPMADERVGAVSGNTKVGNRGGLLGRWQHIEYVTGFNLDRRMYEVLQCTPTVPGAVGAFRRDALEAVGGVPGDTLAEDTDLTLAIGRTGRRVVYAEDARAWTEAPSTLTGLWRQRYRWSFGTMQSVWKHRGAIVSRDPKDRRIGRRALPYMIFFQILLPTVAPLIDLFAIYGLLFLDPVRVIVLWVVFNLIQMVLALYAFILDRESPRTLWAMPLQQFVYRQLMYVVIIESTVSALVGVRAGWKTIPRTGDVAVGSEA